MRSAEGTGHYFTMLEYPYEVRQFKKSPEFYLLPDEIKVNLPLKPTDLETLF